MVYLPGRKLGVQLALCTPRFALQIAHFQGTLYGKVLWFTLGVLFLFNCVFTGTTQQMSNSRQELLAKQGYYWNLVKRQVHGLLSDGPLIERDLLLQRPLKRC